jgi:hypothetical protein
VDDQPGYLVPWRRMHLPNIRAMSEHSDQISAAEFLESSELTARLLRRLTSSPGVINIQEIFETYARLSAFTTRARRLLDDLLTRYSIDDGSAPGSLPLVMEQPWMLNLNTSLTNSNSFLSTTNNSFSATTNEFVSRPILSSSAASQFVPSASSSSHESQPGLATGTVSKHELSHETKAEQLDSVSSSATSGKFRIRRKPGRVSSEVTAAVTQNVQRDPVSEPAKGLTLRVGAAARLGEEEKGITPADPPPAPVGNPASEPAKGLTLYPRATARLGEEEIGTPVKANDAKIATVKNTDSVFAAPADLPLASLPQAPSPVQRGLPDEDVNTSGVLSSDAAEKGPPASQSSNPGRVFSPLNRINETTRLTLGKIGIPRPGLDVSRIAAIQEQIVPAHDQRRQPDSFRTGNADGRTALAEPRQPDLVWRRNAAGRTARELLSAASNGSSSQRELAGGRSSTAQPPPSSQTVKTESVNSGRREAGAEITAEGILRSISNTLLVERDRRGY